MNSLSKLVCMAAIVTVAYSTAVLAHAHLKSSVPAADATVSATPTSLRLRFTEGVEVKFSGVKVSGPGQGKVKLGHAMLAPGSDDTLEVPISGAMPAGEYTVRWHILSKDGHKSKGSYTFTIKP